MLDLPPWLLPHLSPPTQPCLPAPLPCAQALPLCSGASQTQLKYAVEIVIPRATRMLGVLEPLLEQTVFEDVPANLAAIKQRVESMQVGAAGGVWDGVDVRGPEAGGMQAGRLGSIAGWPDSLA